jgi:hypothetical protein
MLARKSLAPWEKARGSRVVVRPLQAAPVEFFEEEEPEQPEPPRIVQRAPGCRPGDRLRRIAAYSSAASTRVKQDGRKNVPEVPWSLKELLDALADELGPN